MRPTNSIILSLQQITKNFPLIPGLKIGLKFCFNAVPRPDYLALCRDLSFCMVLMMTLNVSTHETLYGERKSFSNLIPICMEMVIITDLAA